MGYRYQENWLKHGWYQVVHAFSDQPGLLCLDGIDVAPRANKPWREKPNATRWTTSVSVGEPCVGELHARIDGEG